MCLLQTREIDEVPSLIGEGGDQRKSVMVDEEEKEGESQLEEEESVHVAGGLV